MRRRVLKLIQPLGWGLIWIIDRINRKVFHQRWQSVSAWIMGSRLWHPASFYGKLQREMHRELTKAAAERLMHALMHGDDDDVDMTSELGFSEDEQ